MATNATPILFINNFVQYAQEQIKFHTMAHRIQFDRTID